MPSRSPMRVRVIQFEFLTIPFGAGKTNDDVSIALSCGQRFSANASGKCCGNYR